MKKLAFILLLFTFTEGFSKDFKHLNPPFHKAIPRDSLQKQNENYEELINHIFNDGSLKNNKVYITINNLSKCAITILFSGNDSYTLDISPQSLGRLLVSKGTYNISSKICNAKFNANRKITNDFEMSLNNITTTKKQ